MNIPARVAAGTLKLNAALARFPRRRAVIINGGPSGWRRAAPET